MCTCRNSSHDEVSLYEISLIRIFVLTRIYPWIGLSSERELSYPKSLPKKNEHVRTEAEKKRLDLAKPGRFMLWSGDHFVYDYALLSLFCYILSSLIRRKVLRVVMVLPESPKEAKAEIVKASDRWTSIPTRRLFSCCLQ
jgi:hypothetical protein